MLCNRSLCRRRFCLFCGCLDPETLDQGHVAFLLKLMTGVLEVVDQPAAAHHPCQCDPTERRQQPWRSVASLRSSCFLGLGILCWFVNIHIHWNQVLFRIRLDLNLIENTIHHLLGPQVPVSA